MSYEKCGLVLSFQTTLSNSSSAAASFDAQRVLDLIKNSENGELTRRLDSGLDVNSRVSVADSTESLLVAACIFSNTPIVATLLAHGARIEERSMSGALGESPVAIAMNRGNVDLMEMLIQHGADPEGFTPLMIAVMRGDIIAAEAAIGRGADVNAVNRFGRSSLELAHPIAECVQLLLRHGAKSQYSNTEVATMLGDEMEIRHELELRKTAQSWRSEVRWAVLYDRPAILDLIIAAVPSADSEEFQFRTPVALAAEVGRLECLRVLVRHHADINRVSEGNLTADELARRRNNIACLRFLVAVRLK